MTEHIEEHELIRLRREKLKNISDAGIYAYGSKFETTANIGTLKSDFTEGKVVTAAGRVMAVRLHGKSMFCDLKDSSGKMQAYIKEDTVGADKFAILKDNIDIGDFIGVSGDTFKTRTGEPTIVVKEFRILSKSLMS